VRKKLLQRGSGEQRRRLFKNEMRCLRLLNCLQHPNIIPLLGSYTQNGEYNFLFPRLDMDLETFLKRRDPHGNFRWHFTYFSALHGLASALNNAHNVRLKAATNGIDFEAVGYHHDFRPVNILVNKETFLLADFGLGRLKPATEPSTTPWKVGTGDYLAPECMDDDFVHQDVGRAIDVWAFGCLMADIATFIHMGADGLPDFLEARMSAGSQSNWSNSYFYDQDRNVKPAVKQWLGFLTIDGPLSELNKPFYALIIKVLTGPSQERLKMAQICRFLAILSFKAHFFAVRDQFTKIVETDGSSLEVSPSKMKLWFERERLRAFGNVLGLASIDLEHLSLENIEKIHDNCIRVMLDLFHKLYSYNSTIKTSRGVEDVSRPITVQTRSSSIQAAEADDDITTTQGILEADVQRLVQELWNMLSGAQLKKAESMWVQAMLDTNEVDRLDKIEQALSSETQPAYQEGAALAMMRKIRFELDKKPLSGHKAREIDAGDIFISSKFYGHTKAIYQGSIPVIVEWMYYTPSWDNIPPAERSISMDYKSKGFSINPKPENLRLLDCLGFFEQTQGRRGFGFVHRIPQPAPGAGTPTTLLQLLVQSAKQPLQAMSDPQLNQPLLGDKFRLAYLLAGFLMEFHSIGWLHENFHSNNVIFFDGPNDARGINAVCSAILQEPYIVGLHKSRPGGKSWHTQGPALEKDFLSYQHPDYDRTKQFRVSYDYYSLGLMLLEIGLWYPLKVWSDKPENLMLSPDEFRDFLVKRYIPRLGPKMGQVYQDVVMLCLTDGLEGQPQKVKPDPWVEHNTFIRFTNKVVDPLAELSSIHV
jgi:serine/threonine protein kinase